MKIVHCFVPPIFFALWSHATEVLTDEQDNNKPRITLSSEIVRPGESVEVQVTGLPG